MTGKLYAIGVGPGDPELLTLKAVRILREVSCICVPKGKEEGSSLALSVAEKALKLDNKEIIEAHFPMRKTKESQGTEDRIQYPLPLTPSRKGRGAILIFPPPRGGRAREGVKALSLIYASLMKNGMRQ